MKLAKNKFEKKRFKHKPFCRCCKGLSIEFYNLRKWIGRKYYGYELPEKEKEYV